MELLVGAGSVVFMLVFEAVGLRRVKPIITLITEHKIIPLCQHSHIALTDTVINVNLALEDIVYVRLPAYSELVDICLELEGFYDSR